MRVPPRSAHTCSHTLHIAYKIVCGSMFLFYTVYLVETGICWYLPNTVSKHTGSKIVILYATDTYMLVSSLSVVNLPC